MFVDNQGPTNVSVNAVSTLGETSKIKEIVGYAMQFNKLNQKGLSIVADNSKIELSLLDDEVNLKECTISYTLMIRAGDLSIVPCHRTSYQKFIYGKYIVKNNQIQGIEA